MRSRRQFVVELRQEFILLAQTSKGDEAAVMALVAARRLCA